MTELVTIASEVLTAKINPLGAELWSLTDASGAEYMTDADPAFWTGHAPVLFPIVGELADHRYRLDGAEYPMQRHGFARSSPFEVTQAGADTARFRLADSDLTRPVYPFAFALELAFSLSVATLHVVATVDNPGDVPLPFSIGFHPAFAWPLPGGAAKADHRITFAEPEPQPIRRLDAAGLVLPERFATPVEGHGLTPDASLFEADAIVWDHLASRSVTFGPAGGTQVAVAFPDAPMLGVWQKPGAAYLCIEPWQGHADPQGFAGDFRQKPGIVELAPGGRYVFRMDVTLVAF